MPEFIRPRRAIIETGGGGFLELLCTLAMFAVPLLLLGLLVVFVTAHLVLICACAGVFVAVVGGLAVAMRIHYRQREPLPLPRGWSATAGRELGTQRAALDAPQLAIAPVVHQHIHFHGVTPEDAAAITDAARRWPQ